MLKEAIKEAATIEEAKKLAAEALQLPEENVQFEVLQEPQKKTFGLFGGCDAKVRAFVETADENENASPAEAVKEFLQELLTKMGAADVTLTLKEQDNGCLISLEGENLGFIIGRRGETLDAIQYLTGLVANRVQNAYYRVTLDVGNYREKREDSLKTLAKRHAEQAAKTGRRFSLEPMNPYERRIIHTAVQEIEGATSWSVGSEPNRHVLIGPSDDNPVKANREPREPRRRTGGNGGNRAPRSGETGNRPRRNDDVIERPVHEVRKFIPRSNPTAAADDSLPAEKTLSEKESTATLYGRIDL